MNARHGFLLIFLTGFFSLTSHAEPIEAERVYDLDTSIADALNNSNALLFAKQEIRLNANRVKEAQSLLYPHLNVSANASRFNAEDFYALDPELGSTIFQVNENGDP
ncbi:MAG: hypothetical protein GF384_01930, partial [Elusimicrobia bacterium]|nr:hypothetical protein [Elusimicrobiota bacterium]MBD3411751.1 hypothetical protein [Elusimicrobiota bacterium]